MAGVKPSKFINYISQFKKLLVTRNNGAITQKFKIDSNITDDYYFSIVNSKNQLIDLTGRSFKIYGSIIDAKEVMHILFYSSAADISTNGLEMHFKIDTYTSQYMTMIKNDKVIDLTIVEVIQPQNQQPEEDQITQVILRDQALAYKRPYIQNQVPAEILERVILTTNVPLTGAFGAGQEISLTMGSNGAAFGTGLDQTGNNQLVIGQYNEVDNTKAFIIGNGSDDSNRSNAFTVDYLGNVGANAISATSLVVNGTPVTTQGEVEAEFAATSAWANETFETKTDAFNSHNGLQSSINNLRAELIATSGAIESDIPTKVSQLANDSGYITGYNAGTGISIQNGTISLTGQLGKTYTADEVTLQLSNSNQFSIKSLASKLNQGQNVILTTESDGSVTINAIGGGGGGTGGATYLAGLGLGLSTVSAEDAIYKFYVNQTWLDNKIEQATSDIQNLSAGTGLAIEDNVISLTATIPTAISDLTNDSEFATSAQVSSIVEGYNYLSSISVEYNNSTGSITGITLTDSFINGTIQNNKLELDWAGIKCTQGGGSEYFTEIDSDTLEFDSDSQHLHINIPNSYTEEVSGAAVEAVTGWVDDQNYLTEIPTSYVQQSELESVSGQLTNAIGAKANTTDVEAEFTATSAWANETFLTEHQSLDDYYTKSEVDSAIGTATNDMATQSWVEEQGYLTAHQSLDDYYNKTQVDTALALKADSADVYTKTEVNNISTNIVSQIPTDVATSAYVQAASGNAVSVATGWVDDQNYLTEHQSLADYYNKTEVNAISTALSTAVSNANYLTEVPSEYITETELATELEPYAQSADVTTAITNATSSKVNKTDFDTVSSALSTAIDSKTTSAEVKDQIQAYGYQTATDVANAIAGKADKTELQTVSGTLTSQINGVSERVGTIEADYIKSADMTATSTWVNNTFETQANALTAYNDLTGKINTASTTLTSQVDSLSTAMDNKFTATSGWANGKFETIENVNALTTRVKAIEDDYTTSAYVTGQVNDLATGAVATNTSNIATVSGKVEDIEADYVTSSVLTAYVNNQYVAVSQLANDVGYITAGDLPAGTVYLAGEGLKLQNAVFSLTGSVLSGDGSTIAINNNVISVIGGGGGATYTAGYGIAIDANNEISLTATIPTAISDLTNDSQFATSAQVSAIVTGYNYLSSITVSYYDQNEEDWTTAQVTSIEIDSTYFYTYFDNNILHPTFKGIVINQDGNQYQEGYFEFGDDIVVDQRDGYLILSINSDILSGCATKTELQTTSANIVAQIPSTVFDKLSAGSNITLTKNDQTGVTTIAATGGGGGGDGTIDITVDDTTSSISSIEFYSGDFEGSVYDGNAQLQWKGLQQYGGTRDVDFFAKNLNWSYDFDVDYMEGGVTIGLANPILSTSQLINDSQFATSAQVSAAASAAIESYIDLSGLATGTGLLYDDSDNSLNINLSADANSNMTISADNSGVVWLSAVGGGETYTAGTGLKLEGTEFSLSAAGVNENKVLSSANGTIVWADNATGGGGGGTTYTAGDYISLESDTIAVTGLPSQIEYISSVVSAIPTGAEQTNQQTISAGFTYDSKLEIAKNTYTPTDGVITLSAFEVPAGSLDSNKVAIFEEWVYAKGTLTGFAFDGVTLTNELPSEISQTSYYVFTRRILGSGEQFIKYEYKDVDWNNIPLTFTGKAATNAIQLALPNNRTLDYKLNDGAWTNYSSNTIIELNNGDTVAFSGANDGFNSAYSNKVFAMTGTIEANGNIQSLMNFSNSCTYGCYYALFSGCTSLTKAPVLPATGLAKNCYQYMFYGCSSLTSAPQLPATTLADECYSNMFAGCTKLSTAPALPATGLASQCYVQMFYGCSSLLSAPALPATTLATACYKQMLQYCKSITTPPVLPVTTLTPTCYASMLRGCTALTSAPQLPATTLTNNCYWMMFQNCTSLTDAPQLPATTLTDYCYNSMFYGCSSLSSISVAFTNWTGASDPTADWVNGVANVGVFKCPSELDTTTFATNRVPKNSTYHWTVVNV